MHTILILQVSYTNLTLHVLMGTLKLLTILEAHAHTAESTLLMNKSRIKRVEKPFVDKNMK